MDEKNALKEKISRLPDSPGVYIFRDPSGNILYIGKAKSLKKRVQSYFNRFLSAKTQALVAKIRDVEYLNAASESQAQLKEAALIKDKQPYYNISLKDDKSFPLIRITDEEYPLVSIVRRKKAIENDTAVYFGPYTDAASLRQALKTIRRIFGFRSCRQMPKEACLYGRLKLCPVPCEGLISKLEYRALIERIKMFLDSRYEELVAELSRKMHEEASHKEYERASRIRDQISALSVLNQGKENFEGGTEELLDLQRMLNLKKLPQRIEGFDISNISGQEATGSMVSFYRGRPDKNNYRRFRIKTMQGIDDYGMLREVVHRRYARLKEERRVFPDLILIDGGKGHLATAAGELDKLGLTIPLMSIAKEKENIYTPDLQYPIRHKADTPALNLIRRIRDEAHRFAIAYHHLLHRKKIIGK